MKNDKNISVKIIEEEMNFWSVDLRELSTALLKQQQEGLVWIKSIKVTL